MKSIVIESENIKLSIIPDIGFKVASIIYKPKQKEFLFQPTLGKYDIPSYGDDFEKYDTSGMDEMLPTIDRCTYPIGKFKGRELPDHGDLWSVPWYVSIIDNKVIGSVNLRSLPLQFIKTISFENPNTIRMDYKVKNLSSENIYYLWALHGLNVFNDHTKFTFSDEMKDVLNVANEDDLSLMDLKYLKNYGDKNFHKYYFTNEIKNGVVGLDYTDERIKYTISYNPIINPYLGVWITKGGFKDEYNCALEPSNGFYDNLNNAYYKDKLPQLEAFEEREWTIFIEIQEY
jgi:hypothetical protein